MAQHEPIGRPGDVVNSQIPDKLYFRIGEVSRLCDLPSYVLRFWESEFPQLKPNKGGSGQRLYRRRDVEMVFRIKRLLYEEGYTIPGARQVFKLELRQKQPELALAIEANGRPEDAERLRRLQEDLRGIYAMLSSPGAISDGTPQGVPERRPGTAETSAQKTIRGQSQKLRRGDRLFEALRQPDRTAETPEGGGATHG